MASLGRLSFSIPLWCFVFFESFWEGLSILEEMRPVVVNGDFLATLPVAGSLFFTTCALFCNRLDTCVGISVVDPKECVLLWTSGKDYKQGVGAINALWDKNVPYVPGNNRSYTTDNPVNLGTIPTWRRCHNLCGFAGMKLVKAVFDYDEALAFYKRYLTRFYVDGLREANNDTFYDSAGNEVWSPTSGLNSTIDEPNSNPTGLTSHNGYIGDIFADPDYDEEKLCFCTN